MIPCPLCGFRIPTEDDSRNNGDCQCSREKMARTITRFFYSGQALLRGGYLNDEMEGENPVVLELIDSVQSCLPNATDDRGGDRFGPSHCWAGLNMKRFTCCVANLAGAMCGCQGPYLTPIKKIMDAPTTKDFHEMSQLLCECRKIIDNIVPGCAAGHDELSSLKYRVDLFYTQHDSLLPNATDDRAVSGSGPSPCWTADQ